MSVDFPGYAGPAASTEAPLEMLSACHIRIESHCALLDRIAAHVAAHGSDPAAQSAARKLMRYFDTAAVHHHADEESDLFPALRDTMAGSDAVCIQEIIATLSSEHRQLESMWRRLRSALVCIESGAPAVLPPEGVREFNALYAAHIKREEEELIPMAARLLSDRDIERIGRSMRVRRGIPDLGSIDRGP